MLDALLDGERDPETLAGRMQPQRQTLLQQMLAPIDFLEASLAHRQGEIEGMLQPFEEALTLAQTLPGVGPIAAAGLIAEIGVDMSVFPTQQHLASWAGVCPGNKQSGGKWRQAPTGADETGESPPQSVLVPGFAGDYPVPRTTIWSRSTTAWRAGVARAERFSRWSITSS